MSNRYNQGGLYVYLYSVRHAQMIFALGQAVNGGTVGVPPPAIAA